MWTDFEYSEAFREKYLSAVWSLSCSWTRAPTGAQVRQRNDRAMVVKGRGSARPASAAWTNVSRWKLVFQGRWAGHEHNNVREMRAAVAVLRHISKCRGRWHRRVILFTDSLVALGVLQKGRSSARTLLHLSRQAAAVIFACGLKLYVRWVASEDNVADGPSRGLAIGAAEETKNEHRWRHTPTIVRRLFSVGASSNVAA